MIPPNYALLSIALVFIVVLIPISPLFRSQFSLNSSQASVQFFPGSGSPFLKFQRELEQLLQAENAGDNSTRISQDPLCFYCHFPGHFSKSLLLQVQISSSSTAVLESADSRYDCQFIRRHQARVKLSIVLFCFARETCIVRGRLVKCFHFWQKQFKANFLFSVISSGYIFPLCTVFRNSVCLH